MFSFISIQKTTALTSPELGGTIVISNITEKHLPTDDAYVQYNAADTNFGATDTLGVFSFMNVQFLISYLKFSLPTSFDLITLNLRIKEIYKNVPIEFWICADNSWSEGIITYANKPDLTNKIIDIYVSPSNLDIQIDLKDIVITETISIAIIQNISGYDVNNMLVFYSRETGFTQYRPYIETVKFIGPNPEPEIPAFDLILLLFGFGIAIQLYLKRKRTKYQIG